jgi:hypothetical protein
VAAVGSGHRGTEGHRRHSRRRPGVAYLIWYGHTWPADSPDQGWQPYTGGGVYDPGDITGGHYDHLHISLN